MSPSGIFPAIRETGGSDMPQKRRTVSQPYITQECTLNSRFSQTAYKRIFEQVSGSMYLLGIVLRIIGTDEEALAAEKVVDDMITEVSDELRNEIARLDRLLEANGLEGAHPKYTHPETYEVQLTSPRAGRFLFLIEQLDTLAHKLDSLWLTGILTDQQYANSGYAWQRRVVRLANRIRGITARAIASARSKGEETQKAVEKIVSESNVDVETPIAEDDAGESRTDEGALEPEEARAA
ncbi:MAG: DUF1845 domain-containing protein [Planctomycetota bacterium]|nr:MAG: DUF1845 domain-containing protein [Planctomycetota bacterium]